MSSTLNKRKVCVRNVKQLPFILDSHNWITPNCTMLNQNCWMANGKVLLWEVLRNLTLVPLRLYSNLLQGERQLKWSLTHAQHKMELLPFSLSFAYFIRPFTRLLLTEMCFKNLLDLSINDCLLEGFFNWFLNISDFLVTLLTCVKSKRILPKPELTILTRSPGSQQKNLKWAFVYHWEWPNLL